MESAIAKIYVCIVSLARGGHVTFALDSSWFDLSLKLCSNPVARFRYSVVKRFN